jgi:hypothetical protein
MQDMQDMQTMKSGGEAQVAGAGPAAPSLTMLHHFPHPIFVRNMRNMRDHEEHGRTGMPPGLRPGASQRAAVAPTTIASDDPGGPTPTGDGDGYRADRTFSRRTFTARSQVGSDFS